MIEVIDLWAEMREACGQVLDRHGIKREHMNFGMLLSRVQVRNALVRAEYAETKPFGSEAAKVLLAGEHGITEKYVERILYGG